MFKQIILFHVCNKLQNSKYLLPWFDRKHMWKCIIHTLWFPPSPCNNFKCLFVSICVYFCVCVYKYNVDDVNFRCCVYWHPESRMKKTIPNIRDRMRCVPIDVLCWAWDAIGVHGFFSLASSRYIDRTPRNCRFAGESLYTIAAM